MIDIGLKRRAKWDMSISALRALMGLREYASLARVSERINLSSSAVFCQIRQLEDQLGQKLYERHGKTLQLTASGSLLANFADKIVYMHDSALSAFKPNGACVRDLVQLGCGPRGSVDILPYFAQAFIKQYPRAEIRMTSADDSSLLNDLRFGLLDALFMSLPAEVQGLEQKRLWTYEMALVFPPLSSSHFKNPQVDDLRTAPFILYRRPVLIDDAYQQLCRDLGFEPNVVMENDEPESIKELVKLGLGVSFLPIWQVAEEAHKGKMRIVHLHKPHLYNYGLLYRKSGYKANMLLSLTTVAQQWKQWWPLAKYMGGTPA